MLNSSDLSGVITAANVSELLWDDARELLFYTTTDGYVRSWDPNTGTLIDDIYIGGTLGGLSFAPNGQLYVAQGDVVQTVFGASWWEDEFTATIHVVDIDGADTVTDINFTVTGQERGAFDIAISNTGVGLITTNFDGSGFSRLRQIETAADVISDRSGLNTVTYSSFLTPSENSRYILVQEANTTGGTLYVYDSQTDSFIAGKAAYDLSNEGFGPGSFVNLGYSAISSVGGLIANAAYGELLILDIELNGVIDLAEYQAPGRIAGVDFASDGGRLFALDTDADAILVFDTSNWELIGAYGLQTDVPNVSYLGSDFGEISLSEDDRLVFADTDTGFEIVDLNFASAPVQTASSFADRLYGAQVADTIDGLSGDDFIAGFSGDDTLFGSNGKDTLQGGEGADSLDGGEQDDSILGGAGSDIVIGGGGNDRLFGGIDSDTISGGDGRDSLSGEAGNDSLSGGNGIDTLVGGAGDDTLIGGTGADIFLFDHAGDDVVTDFVSSEDLLDFRLFSDVLSLSDLAPASSGADTVLTLPGGGTITLEGVAPGDLSESDFNFVPSALSFLFDAGVKPWTALPDIGATPSATPLVTEISPIADHTISNGEVVYGSNGPDALISGDGLIDLRNYGLLWIEHASDRVSAVGGHNWGIVYNWGAIVAMSKTDRASGFQSPDWGILQNHGSVTAISYSGEAIGYITFSPSAWGSNEPSSNGGTIRAWSGTSIAFGVNLQNSGAFINSGEILAEGFDAATAYSSTTHYGSLNNSGLIRAVVGDGGESVGVAHWWSGNFDLTNSGEINADIAVSINYHYESDFSLNNLAGGLIEGDVRLLNSIDTVANAGVINGDVSFGDWDDFLDGSLGVINGSVDMGDGADTAFGGKGADHLLGGGDNDLINAGSGNDYVSGGAGNDDIRGDAGVDTISGGAGDDLMRGHDGNDRLYGDDGKDTILGGYGNDLVEGRNGDDFLKGDPGNDWLLGGEGNDSIQGG
ncbi:MAG TPA: calcium-binding protein, partial [Parvularculaceae bacterium]|nr:calcium-binding protein [Parvularculaceae bacterium]